MSKGKIYRFEEFTGSTMSDSPVEFEILDTETNIGNKYSALVVGVENEVLCLYIFFKSFPNSFEKLETCSLVLTLCAFTSDIEI
ncbi:hypothetical protein FDE76_16170 [Clostridium botulinum]|uniref:Uncharacterized protein n=2 Tax=Clostridium TaxID=1485 RepID=B2TJC5_CLOBB|nr:hypothetical protein CLL_A1343 [Clostridium botulinum B str. Eklund 17B (NRP)]MBY6999816.1 hypothetical protein [Clostridium botulinum]MCR1274588.1 hypothetical protein [Clostridium botulinum]NFD71638.1 hypothetical protein [Clostridium botulinum]NFF33504.1 hypothetical protein [Clostridium botulinum]